MSLSEYELKRQRNIAENKKILARLGLDRAKFRVERPPQKRPFFPVKRKRSVKKSECSDDEDQPTPKRLSVGRRRRSCRLAGKAPPTTQELSEEIEAELADKPTIRRIPKNRTNVFGSIAGIEVGQIWETRLECSADGVHRPTVAGIHGSETEGCYSLALSGGYEDDIDMGDRFTYTGSGGRDLRGTKANPKNLRTAPQSSDQTLTRANLALSLNCDNRRPVRVIRGYKCHSRYAPESGYRYDGLYTVERVWEALGLSGFMVYKYALKRCPGQPPLPVLEDAESLFSDEPEGEDAFPSGSQSSNSCPED